MAESLWTHQNVNLIKEFIEHRDYEVRLKGNKVYGIDLAPQGYALTETAIYLQEYDDAPPDNFTALDEVNPEDFKVYQLKEVDWQNSIDF